jgi:hypothetical protein
MTATDLYEIVRDVPREAWPEQFDWYSEEGQSDYRCFTVNGEEYNYKNNLLEVAFVGSMTAWLLSLHELDLRPEANEGLVTHLSIKCDFGEWVGGKSIVAAIAAACKEVSNG